MKKIPYTNSQKKYRATNKNTVKLTQGKSPETVKPPKRNTPWPRRNWHSRRRGHWNGKGSPSYISPRVVEARRLREMMRQAFPVGFPQSFWGVGRFWIFTPLFREKWTEKAISAIRGFWKICQRCLCVSLVKIPNPDDKLKGGGNFELGKKWWMNCLGKQIAERKDSHLDQSSSLGCEWFFYRHLVLPLPGTLNNHFEMVVSVGWL